MELTYRLSHNKEWLAVTGGEGLEGNLVIPSEGVFEGKTYPIFKIEKEAFRNQLGLTSITIPESVEVIGESAFEYCENVVSVRLLSKNLEIRKSAFADCEALKDVVFPDNGSRIEIGDFAFYHCGLEEIYIPDCVARIGEFAFSCPNLRTFNTQSTYRYFTNDTKNILFLKEVHRLIIGVTPGSKDSYCEYIVKAVANAGTKGVVTLPDFVTKIEAGAFMGCQNLTGIVFHDKVTEIGETAFAECTALTQVTLPETIVSIAPNTFCWCENLETVVMPNVKEIGENAFRCCKSLREIVSSVPLNLIGDGAFGGCTSLTRITQRIEAKVLGEEAFSDCDKLTQIHLTDSVRKIGKECFNHCTSLTSINFPDSLKDIGEGAFANCTSLVSINIPGSVDFVDNRAFENCTSLETIVFSDPENDYGIGIEVQVFAGCTSLRKIVIRDASALEDVDIPESVEIVTP